MKNNYCNKLIINYLRFFSLLTILFVLQSSCSEKISYEAIILKDNQINTEFFQNIGKHEKALLTWYLFAYGNECKSNSEKIKCELLELLHIEDECSPKQIDFLKNSFELDILMKFKLKKCPVIPFKGAIQNTIKKIAIKRNEDILTILITVKGMNQMQEKTWNIEQNESYRIKNNRLVKM